MHMVGPGHPFFGLAMLLFIVLGSLAPIIVGFAWVLPDATRRGQPGWLWAILAIPLGWLSILAYLIARAASGGPRP